MKSVIIGAGAYGEVYLAYLSENKIDIIGFLDDDVNKIGTKIQNIPVLGPIASLKSLECESVYCPIGNNKLRHRILSEARKMGFLTPNFIHKDVIISPNVEISDCGVYILGNTMIMPHVKIDEDVMISVGSNIIHHTHLHKGVFISNGVNLGASIDVKSYAYIGMGATVMTGVRTLGENCLIGAGAVAIKDVPDNTVIVGNPGRPLRTNN